MKKIIKCLLIAVLIFIFYGCFSFLLPAEKIPLKYPVILVHGIVSNDRYLFINFWGRIPNVLRKSGVKVFYGNTDAWGTIESNAEILKITIENVLESTGSEKVNIIAHSKGGIDSRYLISKYDLADKIASLTTICSPHHGAVLADLIYKQDIVHSQAGMEFLKSIEILAGDMHPDMIAVNYQLTTEYMKEFNAQHPVMDERVYFQSLFTTMKQDDDPLLFYSYMYIFGEKGENDGVVCATSFEWGDNYRLLSNRLSHIDIIDFRQRKIYGINVPSLYIDIVRDLANRGF